MKIVIIVAYFGKLPNYFQIFLNSCKCNDGFDWMLFTDDTSKYDYPSNVHCEYLTFERFASKVQDKFDFKISLSTPQKLCDYKCAYGYILNDYISDYDWWGHCDLDQIFGDLNAFITTEMLHEYDKLFSLGHLTLYKNTPSNNKIFKNKLNGVERYKQVFTTNACLGFDEWLPNNINEIYINSKRPILLKNIGADINPYKTQFNVTNYDFSKKKYINDDIESSVFKWDNGKLFRLFSDNISIKSIEVPYIHLQKRKMKDLRTKGTNSFYIIPNKFIDACSPDEKLLKNCNKWKILNYQYFIVKFKSLKSRIKNKNWVRQNVFK